MNRLRRIARKAATVTILGMAAAGCDTPSDAEQLAGQYAMVRYRGRAVPADLGPIPDRFGGTTGCRFIVAEGRLQLSGRTGVFTLETVHRESCADRVISRSELSGQYSAEGRTLSFLVPAADGQHFRFTGRVHPDRIVLTMSAPASATSEVLEFAR